jgi:hypothetical protein
MALKISYVKSQPRRDGNDVFVSVLFDAAWDDKVNVIWNEWDAAANVAQYPAELERKPGHALARANLDESRKAYCAIVAFKKLHELPMAASQLRQGR